MELDGTRQKKHTWKNLKGMSFSKNHDPVTQDKPCEKFHAELFSFLIIYMDLLMGERIADDKSSHVVCGLFE